MYIVCFSLFKFAVPYLSFLVMTVLVAASIGLYLIPINYIFMAIGELPYHIIHIFEY